MLKPYANQSIVWEHATERDEYYQPTPVTSTILGRLEDGFKLIRNSEGEQVVSTGVLFTETAVAVGDKIDGRLVIASSPNRGFDGEIVFYEVYLG